MATANVMKNSPAPDETERRHREEKPSADETPPAAVAPEVTRFPTDVDGASHGPVWKSIHVPLKADPANDPSSQEWDQAKQAFKETGLLKRVTSELGVNLAPHLYKNLFLPVNNYLLKVGEMVVARFMKHEATFSRHLSRWPPTMFTEYYSRCFDCKVYVRPHKSGVSLWVRCLKVHR